MRWGVGAIRAFALQAGFPESVAIEAVTLAVASSGGDDAARYVSSVAGKPLEVGLWLIPDIGVLGLSYDRLVSPVDNADAAYALWIGAGGSFAWSPVWRAGIALVTQDAVRDALEASTGPEPADAMTNAPRLSGALRGLRAAVAGAVRNMLDGPGMFQ